MTRDCPATTAIRKTIRSVPSRGFGLTGRSRQ
jgi:hypothetical protein